MKSLEYYFNKAQKEKWAIGQFNFSTAAIFEAIVKAVWEGNSPAILGISEKSSRVFGLKEAVKLIQKQREKNNKAAIFLNLDHGQSFEYIKRAIDLGYDAVHFDGSALSLEKNIQETQKVVNYAEKFNVWVEGEVGVIGGKITDPEEAEQFVKESGVDSLAVSIGNIHGISKVGVNPPLDIGRLQDIKNKIGSFPLVLHGGSGTLAEDIKRAIELGVVKININTEIKQAANLFEAQKVVENKIQLFGSKNKI